MTIACIGWGSLIWKPEDLPIRGPWHSDGPLLPLEFARQSMNGRITIVIVESAQLVRSLWALMSTDDLEISVRALRDREGIPKINESGHIGRVVLSDNPDDKDCVSNLIKSWLNVQGLYAAIWTNLPPKFNQEDQKVPTKKEVVEYLEKLEYSKKIIAEEYFRNAPSPLTQKLEDTLK